MPTDFKVVKKTAHTATLSWSESTPGSSELGTYILRCINCPKDVKLTPDNTTATSIDLTNLGAYATYILLLTNENNITELTNEKFSARLNFTTNQGGMYLLMKTT